MVVKTDITRNSLTTKKQMTKFLSAKFSKKKKKIVKSKLYHIENSKTRWANSVHLDEVAHNEPPHQDLRCVQIQLYVSLVLKESKEDGTLFKSDEILLFLTSIG